MALECWASAKLYGVEQRAPPIFGRAAITLGIGPHSSLILFSEWWIRIRVRRIRRMVAATNGVNGDQNDHHDNTDDDASDGHSNGGVTESSRTCRVWHSLFACHHCTRTHTHITCDDIARCAEVSSSDFDRLKRRFVPQRWEKYWPGTIGTSTTRKVTVNSIDVINVEN